MPITTKVVSSNLAHGEVYLIQHYVIMFVGYFSPGTTVFTPIEIDRYGMTEILLKVVLNTITLTLTAMLFELESHIYLLVYCFYYGSTVQSEFAFDN